MRANTRVCICNGVGECMGELSYGTVDDEFLFHLLLERSVFWLMRTMVGGFIGGGWLGSSGEGV